MDPTPPEGYVPAEERLKADWKCLTVSTTPTNANIQTVRKKRGVVAVAETQKREVQANANESSVDHGRFLVSGPVRIGSALCSQPRAFLVVMF